MKLSHMNYIVLIIFMVILSQENSYMFLVFTAAILFLTLLLHFTQNKYTPDKLILISILTAIASLGRILFVWLPSIQLSSFIIILTGIVFGPGIAFITGILTAVMSNFFQGQGLWTIWQMFCFGIMGLFSGLFAKSLRTNKIWRTCFGMAAGIIFGWIMNIMTIIYIGGNFNIANIIPIYAMSFFFDIIHGTTNALLLFIVGDACIEKFEALKLKIHL